MPEIEFVVDEKTQKKFKIMPPCMDMESALLNYFINEKGATTDDIKNDKETAFQYTYIRSLMHLIDKEGNWLINNPEQFGDADKYLSLNKYTTISQMYASSNEVDAFGVQADHWYQFKCKECGGMLAFQLPLLHGLVE